MNASSEFDQTLSIDPEDLAYWYFRLNGFLTIKNFVVHPDTGSEQRTDVDIIACRFPYRAELITKPMIDDGRLVIPDQRILIYLAEATHKPCKINGPWTNKIKGNMQLVLRALGAFPHEEIECIAQCLYANGYFKNDKYLISLLSLGSRENSDLKKSYPEVPQIIWSHVLAFIYQRFHEYPEQKLNHSQWDSVGKEVFNLYRRCNTKGEFVEKIKVSTKNMVKKVSKA